jgi:hypothetical protein
LSLLKHPFTGFAGIGVYADTPQVGKRRVSNAAVCRFPARGEALPKAVKGCFLIWKALVQALTTPKAKPYCLWAI